MATLDRSGWTIPLPLNQHERSQRYAINPKIAELQADKRQQVAMIKQERIERVRDIVRKAACVEPKPRFARGLRRDAA
jgi:hypothetical protein